MSPKLSRFFSLGNGNSGSVKDIIQRSSRATCGTFEREVVVKAGEVAAVKARLRSKGMMIVGTSEPVGTTRKIWFISRGLAGL